MSAEGKRWWSGVFQMSLVGVVTATGPGVLWLWQSGQKAGEDKAQINQLAADVTGLKAAVDDLRREQGAIKREQQQTQSDLAVIRNDVGWIRSEMERGRGREP